jgi:outer membrane protein OmpA-like peptidoglycan-associated protein
VSKATARSLFGIATSMVLSYLGRMIRTERLNPTALSSRLAAERDSIVGGLPPALAKFYPSVPAAVSNVAAATPTAGVPASGTIAKQRSALSWALPATLAALVVWGVASFFGHSRAPEPARTVSVIAVPGAVGTGGFVRQELPSGKRLQLSPNGTEARLLAFMQRRGPVTKEDWFEFDRLNFETNSAMLTSDSKDQLSNVAEILKAYPRVSVKIGGYTDNTGDAAANLELSRKRAEAVRNQLEEMGIDAKRISAEGYGAQHPIANNDTAEGRMQNRRIAIRVTAK